MSRWIGGVLIPRKRKVSVRQYLKRILAPYDENLERPLHINRQEDWNETLERTKRWVAKQGKELPGDTLSILNFGEPDFSSDQWLSNEKGGYDYWTTYNEDGEWDWWRYLEYDGRLSIGAAIHQCNTKFDEFPGWLVDLRGRWLSIEYSEEEKTEHFYGRNRSPAEWKVIALDALWAANEPGNFMVYVFYHI